MSKNIFIELKDQLKEAKNWMKQGGVANISYLSKLYITRLNKEWTKTESKEIKKKIEDIINFLSQIVIENNRENSKKKIIDGIEKICKRIDNEHIIKK